MFNIVPFVTTTLPVAYTAYNNRDYAKFLIGLVIFTILAIVFILMSHQSLAKGVAEFFIVFLIFGSGWGLAVFYSWYYTAKHLGRKKEI